MRKFFASFLALGMFLGSSQLHAQVCDDLDYYEEDACCETPCCDLNNSFYAKVFGGANIVQTNKQDGVTNHFKTGYLLSGALGYNWRYGLSVEAEFTYRRNEQKNIKFFGRDFHIHGHYQSSSVMANLIWNIPLCNWRWQFWGLKPFVGAGVGYDLQRIHAKTEGISYRNTEKHFAWQVMAGVLFPAFCNIDISLEYRFHKGGFKKLYENAVGIGILYKFSR